MTDNGKKNSEYTRVHLYIAALFLICFGILPVSANMIAPVINQSAVVYIGEEGLNLTHALNQAHGAPDVDGVPGNTVIGWWSSAGSLLYSSPTKTINISTRYQSFKVNSSDFVGYTGNWYQIDNTTGAIDLTNGGVPRVAFIVADPVLAIGVWDFDQANEVTGLSVHQGARLGIKIRTNMYGALDDRYRSPVYHTAADGYIHLMMKNESGTYLTELATGPGTTVPLTDQAVTTVPCFWPSADGSVYWQTDAHGPDNAVLYPVGIYRIWAESRLNGMKENYKNAGSDYTGKTVSATSTVTLISDTVQIESNRDSVIQGSRFSVTISGRPATKYYLWVKDDGSAPLPVNESPPSILASAPVIQDPPEGPFTIGSYQIQNGNGRILMDAVPPSTLNKTHYYAAVMTNRGGTATVEFQAWNKTRPDEYTFHAESGTLSDEVNVTVDEGWGNPYEPAPRYNPDKVIRNPRINNGVTAPDSSDYKRILQGATIFIGEEGLNVTAALNQAHGDGVTPYQVPAEMKIGWWASAATITYFSPTKTVDLANQYSSMTVEPADFVGYTGNWYLVNPDTGMADLTSDGSPRLAFTIQDPTLSLAIWDLDQIWDVTGTSVPHGERLTFRINTNMYAATYSNRPDVSTTTPGFITLKMKDENGATCNFLYQNNTTSYNLTNQFVDRQPDYWSTGVGHATAYWGTDLLDTDGNYFYPSGTYSAWAESTLNNMKNNYKNAGADYTGKTVSATGTVTLVSDTVKIEANKASLLAGSNFSVTVSGRPNASYFLWVNNTRSLDSSSGNRPPMISTGQEKVYMDNSVDASHGIHPIGNYVFANGNGTTVFQDVAQGTFARGNKYNSTRYYARILTGHSGTRTVQFETDSGTSAQDYSIRTEQNFDGQYKRDDVTITVRKTAGPAFVSITPAGPWYRNATINYTITGSNFQAGFTSVVIQNKSGLLLNASPQAAGSGVWLVTPTRIYGTITIPYNASSVTPYNVTVTVQGCGKAVKELALTVANIPKPTIASISSSGPYYLNTTVNYTITGTNFQPDKTVLFFRNRTGTNLNATPDNSGVTLITPTRITGTITIPSDASTITPYNITVTTLDGGTGAKESAFTISRRPSPTISSLTPVSGSKNTTIAFTVTGKNFRTEPGYTNVTFVNGFTDARIYGKLISVTSTTITGTLAIPAGSTGGSYDLIVTTVDGGSAGRESAFTIVSLPLPVITAINQTSGYRNTTVPFAITGNYFQPDGGTFVRLYTSTDGSVIPAILTNVTGTRMTGMFRIPSGAVTGTYRLDVITVSGGSGGKPNAFAVKPLPGPQITSVSPAQSYRNRTFVITVTGNYFEPDGGTIADLTSPTGNVVMNISLINVTPTRLNGTVTIPADAPTTPLWKLNVTTIDGGLSTKVSAIAVQSYPRPTFTSITPTGGLNGTVVSFTVKGTNLQTGGTDITFWNRTGNIVLVPTITSVSSTQMSGTLSIPSHASQSWYVNISTVDGGALSREKAFSVY